MKCTACILWQTSKYKTPLERQRQLTWTAVYRYEIHYGEEDVVSPMYKTDESHFKNENKY